MVRYYTYKDGTKDDAGSGLKDEVGSDAGRVRPADDPGKSVIASSGVPSAVPSAACDAKVSVIIPVYNASTYLDQALSSVRRQTYTDLEIICVNDGSSDGSLDIIRRHAAHDGRIQIIDKENEGYGAACNCAIARASGRWIAILEPDDWIEDDMYADMLAFAAGFSEKIDIVKAPFWRFVQTGDRLKKQRCNYKYRIRPHSQPFVIGDQVELLCHHPSVWSALYRRTFLERCGISFKPLPGAGWADNLFLIETMLQAKAIVYVDKEHYCYRADSLRDEDRFYRTSPLVPLRRWLEMDDIVKRLDIVDADILGAHYSRAFRYIRSVYAHIGDSSTQAQDIDRLAEEIYGRMDRDVVCACPRLSSSDIGRFCAARNIGKVRHQVSRRLGHIAYLAGNTVHSLRTTGLAESAGAVFARRVRRRT